MLCISSSIKLSIQVIWKLERVWVGLGRGMGHSELRAMSVPGQHADSERERSVDWSEVLFSLSITRHFGLHRSRCEKAFFPTLDQLFKRKLDLIKASISLCRGPIHSLALSFFQSECYTQSKLIMLVSSLKCAFFQYFFNDGWNTSFLKIFLFWWK